MGKQLQLVRALSSASEPAHGGDADHVGLIRLARGADLQEVGALARGVIGALEFFQPNARQSEIGRLTAEALMAMLARAPDSVIIARAEGRIIGFCTCHVDPGLLYMDWWGVRPDARRRGVCRGLFAAVEELARERGCHKIGCESHADNHVSAKSLEKAGFRKVGPAPVTATTGARAKARACGVYLAWEKAIAP